MAHFAKIGRVGRTVVKVVVVNNDVITDGEGNEQESLGQQFLKDLYDDQEAIWLQTSYNGNFRNVYASVGGTYDDINDEFIHKKPHGCESWRWNRATKQYDPPVAKPETTNAAGVSEVYKWNEGTYSWIMMPSLTPPE